MLENIESHPLTYLRAHNGDAVMMAMPQRAATVPDAGPGPAPMAKLRRFSPADGFGPEEAAPPCERWGTGSLGESGLLALLCEGQADAIAVHMQMQAGGPWTEHALPGQASYANVAVWRSGAFAAWIEPVAFEGRQSQMVQVQQLACTRD